MEGSPERIQCVVSSGVQPCKIRGPGGGVISKCHVDNHCLNVATMGVVEYD
jgi:hypothetical protein